MDAAIDMLKKIHGVYTEIKDGQDHFKGTYDRLEELLKQFQAVEASETFEQSELLTKYIAIADGFLANLTKYKNRRSMSKLMHQSEMLAEIDGFNQELEALF